MKIYKYLLIFPYILLTCSNLIAQDIFRAVCQGNTIRLDSMLIHSSIDTIDDRGRSLLHWAVACRQSEVIEILSQKGIKIGTQDNDGLTPMHMAVGYDNEPLFLKLVELQNDKNWINDNGISLLEKAILNKNLNILKALINSGADINQTNQKGSTPLEISIKTKSSDITKWLIASGADESLVRSFHLKGAYFGQKPPGATPEVFAPNFISTEESEFGSVFNAEATEFYYGVDVNGTSEIRFTQLEGDTWSQPVNLFPKDRYDSNDPFLSPDENRLYFISQRPIDGEGELKDYDIWYVQKGKEGWSKPINAGPNINTDGDEYYISFTREGTMYFASNGHLPKEEDRSDHDIYYSTNVNQEFQKAIAHGDAINTDNYEADVYIDPDESFMIFCGRRPNGMGMGDLYISFQNHNNTWSKAINMGDKINTDKHELCPYITADGKYLLYTSNQDIYWVSTDILESYKK